MRYRLRHRVFGLFAVALLIQGSAAIASDDCIEVFRKHDAMRDADLRPGSDDASAIVGALTSCAQDGDADARVIAALVLGNAYFSGWGVSKDLRTAAKWYENAARNDQKEAQFNLAWMYDTGAGVPRDVKAAAFWYERAASQGHAVAQLNLSILYESGQGVVQDYKAAVRWLKRGAEQGNVSAQVNLGAMYAEGKGVRRDPISAHMWFNIAASQGSENALINRERIARTMTANQVDDAQERARRCLAAKLRNCSP